MTRRLAAALCAMLLIAGCGLVHERTVSWDNGELSFDYPKSWTNWGSDAPSAGPPEVGQRVEVGGRDARFSEEATDDNGIMLRWAIDDPYASYLAVWAEIQGPDEAKLRGQVQALVDSIAFSPLE